jgi:hypothetical protein
MSILIDYVDDILTPTEEQYRFIKSKARSVQKALTKNATLTPKEIHVGGSFIKGTMLKNKLDIDLVYAYNKCEEVGNNWRKLSTIIFKVLKNNFPKIEIEEAGNLAIHFKTSLEKMPVNIDIVPCYYVNSPEKMFEHTNSKLYMAITTIWHCRYLIRYKKLPYFTFIVRLLKDWKNEQDVPIKNIHLELIAADVYDNIIEDINSVQCFDDILIYCFENILDTFLGYPVIPFNWKYCNISNYKDKYNIPVIFDPANPTDNLLKNISKEDIKKIKRKTKITIENLKEQYYAEIFNRKGLTKYFD